MTKQQLIRNLAAEKNISIRMAREIVDAVFHEMSSTLIDEQRVELRGFGTFKVKSHDGYIGRNPRTGETVFVQPKKTPFFKMGKELGNLLNNGHGEHKGDGSD